MELSCARDTYFRIWSENQIFFIEDSNFKHSISISISLLQWLEASLVDMLHLSINSFFQRKSRLDSGTIRLSKFRSSRGWFLECAVWLPTGGRKNVHVPAGMDKKGWYVFWEMLFDFLNSFGDKYRININPLSCDGEDVLYQNGVGKEVGETKSTLRSYVDVVKSSYHSPSSEFSQFWIRKERDLLDLDFSKILVVTRFLAHY